MSEVRGLRGLRGYFYPYAEKVSGIYFRERLGTTPATPATPAVSIRACFDCGEAKSVLVEMQAGRDGVPWWLCCTCLYPREPVRPAPKKPDDAHRTKAPRRTRDPQRALNLKGPKP